MATRVYYVLLLCLLAVQTYQQKIYTYDLDDQQVVAALSARGINLRVNEQVNAKITSSDGNNGYSWIVDYESCDRTVQIQASFQVDQETSTGEELYTLKAMRSGECKFRIAFARPWEFTTFENHERQGNYMISIPIYVAAQNGNTGGNGGSSSSGSDYSGRWVADCEDEYDCQLREEYSISYGSYQAFKAISIINWLRATVGLNPFSYLPAAFAFIGAKKGRVRDLKSFIWTNQYWAQIFGWLTTFGYIYLYGYVWGVKYWYLTTLAVLFDFFGWPFWYVFKGSALRYARYQIAKQERPFDY